MPYEQGKSTLNVITPVTLSGLHPDNTLPGAGSAGGEHPDHTLPGDQPHPDHTLPGDQPYPSHPIYFPDQEPSHPIVLPPEGGGGEGGEPPHPDQTLPGDLPHVDNSLPIPPEVVDDPGRFEVKTGWTAETGWVVVFVPTGNVPTPSKRR